MMIAAVSATIFMTFMAGSLFLTPLPAFLAVGSGLLLSLGVGSAGAFIVERSKQAEAELEVWERASALQNYIYLRRLGEEGDFPAIYELDLKGKLFTEQEVKEIFQRWYNPALPDSCTFKENIDLDEVYDVYREYANIVQDDVDVADSNPVTLMLGELSRRSLHLNNRRVINLQEKLRNNPPLREQKRIKKAVQRK